MSNLRPLHFMDQPLLSMQHVMVRFLNNTLFENLNFVINKGENWALIGKSGSGKSALLQTIAGRFNIISGEIRYHFFEDFLADNHLKDETLTYHKLVALVESKHHFRNLSNTTEFYYQQRYNSSDSENALTVEQYLAQIKTVERSDNYWTINKVVETLNLGNLFIKQLIKLSNGETKRLMIAAALLKNPVILLLDTPLTGLDVETRESFSNILKEITSSGISIIMAASAYEIPGAITHIAVLEDGDIKKIILKSDFHPSLYKNNISAKIDKQKLGSLISTSANPVYNCIVKMTNVHIQYADKVILHDVNWQILPGERWALLGANGAGKSTLLSLINGDNPQAYANDIILFDRQRGSGESIWDIKSKIGFVSPELHQYFPVDNSCMQVIESGYYDTLGLFRPSQKTQADAALKWMQALEIDKYARVLLKNIPASVQRLCLLARALIKNPTLLIFDEPCQGMDSHPQMHFKQVVNAICDMSNVTLIYVTHYQHEIPDSVTKVLRLNKGMVVSEFVTLL